MTLAIQASLDCTMCVCANLRHKETHNIDLDVIIGSHGSELAQTENNFLLLPIILQCLEMITLPFLSYNISLHQLEYGAEDTAGVMMVLYSSS